MFLALYFVRIAKYLQSVKQLRYILREMPCASCYKKKHRNKCDAL